MYWGVVCMQLEQEKVYYIVIPSWFSIEEIKGKHLNEELLDGSMLFETKELAEIMLTRMIKKEAM